MQASAAAAVDLGLRFLAEADVGTLVHSCDTAGAAAAVAVSAAPGSVHVAHSQMLRPCPCPCPCCPCRQIRDPLWQQPHRGSRAGVYGGAGSAP